jgi:hypothetical protein
MKNKKPTEYIVGYGKPPVHSRFQKGQSGNRKGRPKNSKSFVALLAEALEERVFVQEGGRRRSLTKREALAKQFANKGATGDLKAAKILLEILGQVDDHNRVVQLETQERAGQSAHERVAAKLDRIQERIHARIEALAAEQIKKPGS